MSKIELPAVTGNNNTSRINDNFKKIEDALNQEVLYRKGYVGEPNEMDTNLDMNSKEILNVRVGTSPGSLVTRGYVDQEIAEERSYVDQELAKKFDKSGGPLSGPVNMQNNQINNLPNATQPSQPATYAQLLQVEAPGDSLLRNDLAAPGGAGLVGAKLAATGSVYRTQADRNLEFVSVKDFGAKGDGVTDDTIPLQACADYCNNNRLTMWWPDGAYRTTGTITVSSNAGLVMETRVVLQNKGIDKSFAAISIAGGGGRRRTLGVIDGYGDGLFLEGNTSNVDFQVISNCTRGVVIAAMTSSSLDNVVKGVQIGLCTEGITFLQNGKRIQQGNEIRVNFVSNTKHSLVFDDQGTHTSVSSWDSNLVVLQASDPAFIPGATLLYNKSGFSVPNLTYSVETWAGGWNLDDGTMTVIKGLFSTGYFTFNFAASVSSAIFCETTNKASIDSCFVFLKRKSNLGAGIAASYIATPPGDLSAFNGGKEVTAGVFRVKLSHPDLAAGATNGQSFYHFLSQTSYGARFKIRSIERGSDAGNYSIRVQDAGTEYRGMVRTWVTNKTNAIIPAGDIYIVVECSG